MKKLIRNKIYLLMAAALMMLSTQCRKPQPPVNTAFSVTPYDFSKDNIANHYFPDMPRNPDNPITKEGVTLGRMLFYDPILSADSSQSCSSCHKQENGFASNAAFQTGVHGTIGVRSSMPLNNLAWENVGFFWDGRSKTLEDQVIHPVENPIEMAENWNHVIMKLKRSTFYPEYYRKAFEDGQITEDNTAKALAQFLRTLISSHSKFDSMSRHLNEPVFNASEERGFQLFTHDPVYDPLSGVMTTHGADCGHCHQTSMNFQDYTAFGTFRNNGLDSVRSVQDFRDKGYGAVSGDTSDYGKFKVPSLRNVALSAPYMHDGRFATLEDVINHYDSGGRPSPNIDQFMGRSQFASHGGRLNLSEQDKKDLVNFLKTLTDTVFINDKRYSNPFKK